jgi:PAS domain S-box-containing protein
MITGMTREHERALLEAVVRQIPVGLIAVDPAGVPLAVNDEARKIFGEPDMAVHDENWQLLSGGRGTGVAERPLTRALVFGDVVLAERFEVLRRDGQRRLVEVSATPIRNESGEIVAAVATFHDLTRRDDYERAQRDFITNAAHELQSPLAAIVSASDVLKAGAKETADRDLFLGHIEREAGRLTQLVRAMLMLARAQTAREELRTEVVELEPLLREIAEGLEPGEDVTVEVSCPPSLAVLSNADLVRHAVENLGRNATKFTSRGTVRLEASALDGAVEIVVADTGPGIPPELRARVFERFYQGTAGEGFGLGLAIVHNIADAIGGEVHIDASDGGTVIRLRLPAAASLVTE